MAVLLVGAVAMIAVFLDLSEAASLINFGAFVAFTSVCVSVVVHHVRTGQTSGAKAVLLGFVLPGLGALVNLSLLLSLDTQSKVVGVSWVVIGLIALLVMTRGFRKPLPQIDLRAADD